MEQTVPSVCGGGGCSLVWCTLNCSLMALLEGTTKLNGVTWLEHCCPCENPPDCTYNGILLLQATYTLLHAHSHVLVLPVRNAVQTSTFHPVNLQPLSAHINIILNTHKQTPTFGNTHCTNLHACQCIRLTTWHKHGKVPRKISWWALKTCYLAHCTQTDKWIIF